MMILVRSVLTHPSKCNTNLFKGPECTVNDSKDVKICISGDVFVVQHKSEGFSVTLFSSAALEWVILSFIG